ncbi:hypothetical protein KL86APRO_12658 [uncultured Alphaproteobacteria bacterium]|uniref:Uncharacterized protein n=1 Tax=uncultured Alphaproteobacteria bacterium TaxID=91750 RepID=A0A212KDC4_9PROT|nr:hypothetical protein KL86APRO_12658 [uncultured Alphaproteobacteria bacterium]
MTFKQRLRGSFIGTLIRKAIRLYWLTIGFPRFFRTWSIDRLNRHTYRRLSEEELRAARRSDTVFICGTGASLLNITPEEWARIGEHDVFSFRDFPRQTFVRADFHMSGEIDVLDDYAAAINDNPRYADAKFLVQEGWEAWMCNLLIGKRKLRTDAPVFRYRRTARGKMALPNERFADGVVHGGGSVVSAANIALMLGWTRIVFVGIDLYDHRYFYMPPDQTRALEKKGVTHASAFSSGDLIVEQLGTWAVWGHPQGIEFLCYNPRSLLTRRLPIFDWDTPPHSHPHQPEGASV